MRSAPIQQPRAAAPAAAAAAAPQTAALRPPGEAAARDPERARRFGHDLARLTLRTPPLAALPAAAAPPIQRVIDPRALQEAHEGGRLGQLPEELLGHVAAFNEADVDAPENEDALHGRFARLHAIESAANAHLRQARDGVHDHDRQALFGLLSQVETHQARLTRHTLDTGARPWLPDSVQGADRDEAHRLWGSISQNAGNLRIETDSRDFHAQTLAGVGKLLQGEHGRGLLGELDAAQPREGRGVVISDNHRERFERLIEKHDPGSWAHPMGEGDKRRGHGTGSWVQIDETPPATLDDHQTGTAGEPIFAPNFITLGHELGHARHNLRGEARSQFFDPGIDFQTSLWTNPEEYQNITQQENPLREEHGLAERRYHHTARSARDAQRPFDIRQRFATLTGGIPDHLSRAAGGQFGIGGVARRVEQIDPGDHKAVDALHHDVADLERNVPGWVQEQPPQQAVVRAPRRAPQRAPAAQRGGGLGGWLAGAAAGAGGFLRRNWRPLAAGAAAVGGGLLLRHFLG